MNDKQKDKIEPSGYTIEHSIPVPERKKRGGIVDTLRTMNVGDSVLVERKETPNWHSTARTYGYKVAVRLVSETESRVWRVA